MYCPNCGNKTSSEQKFCRSCGLGLEKTAQSLVEQLIVARPEESLQDSQANLEQLKTIGLIACTGGLSLIVASIIYLLVTVYIPQAIYRESPVGVMVSLAVLLFLLSVVFALSYLYYTKYRKGLTNHQRKQPTSLPQGDASTRWLSESRIEPIPSIIERTTELIGIGKPKKVSRKKP